MQKGVGWGEKMVGVRENGRTGPSESTKLSSCGLTETVAPIKGPASGLSQVLCIRVMAVSLVFLSEWWEAVYH